MTGITGARRGVLTVLFGCFGIIGAESRGYLECYLVATRRVSFVLDLSITSLALYH